MFRKCHSPCNLYICFYRVLHLLNLLLCSTNLTKWLKLSRSEEFPLSFLSPCPISCRSIPVPSALQPKAIFAFAIPTELHRGYITILHHLTSFQTVWPKLTFMSVCIKSFLHLFSCYDFEPLQETET